MKKIDSFIKNIFATGLGCIAIFAGCAGFTEDTNSSLPALDVGDDVGAGFASARVSQVGKALVNESKDSVTFVVETFGGCFLNDGTLFYDPDYYVVDEYRYAYSFSNDTLQLSYISEGEKTTEHITALYVGGTSGVLDGTWLLTQCFYLDGVYGCNNDAYDKFFKIDGDKVEARVGDVANYDYMKSDFVGDIFRFLNGKNTIMFEDVFYSWYDNSPEKYGITIQEKTKRSMRFVYDDHVFDLNLDYVRYMDSVSVRLSSDGVTCIGQYHKIRDISPEMCREEYAPYLEIGDYKVSKYEKQNIAEFKACIDGILGRKKD